jgi:hypothetical protein
MGFDPSPFFNQTVTVYAYSANTANNPLGTYAAEGTAYSARVDPINEVVRVSGADGAGEEVVATSKVLLPSTATITYRDKIELPNGSTPKILKIQTVPWIDGTTSFILVMT